MAREAASANKIGLLKILYKPMQVKRVANAIERDEDINAAAVYEMHEGAEKEVKRILNSGRGRTGLMRLGSYIVNGDGEVVAEPEELKRQTYGLGQKKIMMPGVQSSIVTFKNEKIVEEKQNDQ